MFFEFFMNFLDRDSGNLYSIYILYSLVLIFYLKCGGGLGNVFLAFYSISNIFKNKILGIKTFFGDIEKCPFTYWLNGRWFHQIVDIGNFNMTLNGRWFPQIVDRDSGNLYPIYIQKNVVLASELVGRRSRATELPCYIILFISEDFVRSV